MESIERFITAQDSPYQGYETALSEIREGRKNSHWIWYIFPQLRGLGQSSNSYFYGIENTEEAKSYLAHPILGSRLQEITRALLTHTDKDIRVIMGGHTDAMKLLSSMTLFESISQEGNIFSEVIEAFYKGRRDALTIKLLISKK